MSTAKGAGSRPRKRSITIAGHSTSISLEEAFWTALQDISAQRDQRMADLIAEIDKTRGDAGLSGAIRVFLLEHYKSEHEDQGRGAARQLSD